MKRLFTTLAFLALAGAVSGRDIDIKPEFADDGWRLAISGDMPVGWCGAAIAQAKLEDRGLVVLLIPDQTKCVGPTETFSVATQFRFDAGLYPVRVYIRDLGTEAFRLAAFDLVEADASPPRLVPEAGMWWPGPQEQNETSGPGIGFSIELQGDNLVIVANVYDTHGNPVWMIGSGKLTGKVAELDLLSLSGGQYLFGDYFPPESAIEQSKLSIEFKTPARATLWFETENSESGEVERYLFPVDISRYAFGLAEGPESLLGRWIAVLPGRTVQLSFDEVVRKGSQASLKNQDGDLFLYCSTDIASPTCQLADGTGQVHAELNQIGLNRLYGETRDGLGVEILRLHGVPE